MGLVRPHVEWYVPHGLTGKRHTELAAIQRRAIRMIKRGQRE